MFIEPRKKRGWIEVISGPMFSGKTEELIRRVNRAVLANKPVIIFKPRIDDRYHPEHVTSHNGNGLEAVAIDHPEMILTHFSGQELVAIDEAQFFGQGLVDVANQLANKGVRVLIAGLDMDHKAQPFGPVPTLLATAEYITKLHAICLRCGDTATFTYKKSTNGKVVEVGKKDLYESLCRTCYNEASQKFI